MSMPSILGCSFLLHQVYSTGCQRRVSMPSILGCSFLLGSSRFYKDRHITRVNALYLGLLISTPPLKIPSIYAAFRAYFCRYFSEYSENFFKNVLKVGKRRIVFLRYNFLQFNNQSYFRDFTDGFPKLLCYTFILITIIKSIKKFDNKNNLYTHQSTGKSTL